MTTTYHPPRVIPPDHGERFNVLGETVISILAGADTGGVYAVQQQISPPGAGPPLHVHHREDEGFTVLEGEYEFCIGDQVIRAVTGTFLFAPRDVPHRFRCLGPGRGRMQVIIAPAGFEEFFRELDGMARDGAPAVERLVELARKYGLEFLDGPPAKPSTAPPATRLRTGGTDGTGGRGAAGAPEQSRVSARRGRRGHDR